MSGITQYLKRKCAAVAIRSLQADVHVEPLDNDSLPDRLINPEEYEPLSHTPQRHASAEPTDGANEVQRLTPVYTSLTTAKVDLLCAELPTCEFPVLLYLNII